jgi:hypothetical protein
MVERRSASPGYGLAVTRPLPPPLPPAERTVGQVVAEAIRLWPTLGVCLALGLPVALVDQTSVGGPSTSRRDPVGGNPLLTAARGAVVLLVAPAPSTRARLRMHAACSCSRPFRVLIRLYLLPALAWLALFGLSVPAAALERLGVRAALTRGRQLAAADYVHALGSLCALGIVYFVTRAMLFFLLRGQADAAERVAAFLGDLVLSPLLYLGAALVYFDQSARLSVAQADGKIQPQACTRIKPHPAGSIRHATPRRPDRAGDRARPHRRARPRVHRGAGHVLHRDHRRRRASTCSARAATPGSCACSTGARSRSNYDGAACMTMGNLLANPHVGCSSSTR